MRRFSTPPMSEIYLSCNDSYITIPITINQKYQKYQFNKCIAYYPWRCIKVHTHITISHKATMSYSHHTSIQGFRRGQMSSAGILFKLKLASKQCSPTGNELQDQERAFHLGSGILRSSKHPCILSYHLSYYISSYSIIVISNLINMRS